MRNSGVGKRKGKVCINNQDKIKKDFGSEVGIGNWPKGMYGFQRKIVFGPKRKYITEVNDLMMLKILNDERWMKG